MPAAPTSQLHVAICCITFRRPDGLRRLLDGINALAFKKTNQPQITVLVVDNDKTAPMSDLVNSMRSNFRWQLIYACEPEQGLTSARNRTLAMVPENTDFVAFVDDDEVPVPIWLDELLSVASRYDAPIVMGPVEPHFLGDPPAWVDGGAFFVTGPYADGDVMSYGYTSNSLVSTELIRKHDLRFDRRFNHTGGEDQHFFGRLLREGASIVASANAMVVEWIPASRTNLSYLLRRRFRMGTTLSMIDRIEAERFWLPIRLAKACGRVGLGLCQCVLLLPKGMVGLATGALNIAWGAGSIVGLFGIKYQEYSAKRR